MPVTDPRIKSGYGHDESMIMKVGITSVPKMDHAEKPFPHMGYEKIGMTFNHTDGFHSLCMIREP